MQTVIKTSWNIALLNVLVFCALISLTSVSCSSLPDLTESPKIKYKSLRFAKGNPNTVFDTMFLTLDFEDGNGDLGLSSNETTGNFALLKDDGSINENHYNIMVRPFIKAKGAPTFVEKILCPSPPCPNNFNGRYPRLLFDNVEKPLQGEIVYNFISSNFGYDNFGLTDSVIRFEVFIRDRMLNVSNTITTDTVLIK
jgi:hypothetical protein